MTGPAVIVVAYGQPEALSRALIGVGHLDVHVVDNSSSPDVRAVALAAGATYDDPGENLGFGRAVNRGLQRVTGDVLLLNPDAEVTAETVEALSVALRADDRLAAVAPAQVDPVTGQTQRVVWPFPSPLGAWREAVGLSRMNDRHADFVIGAVLLLRAEALADVGPFDERFFLYAEETDWQRRATANGWGVSLVPDAQARHEGAGTSTDEGVRLILFHAGQETYARKWFGSAGWASFRGAAITGSAVRSVLRTGPDREEQRARLSIYVRGPRRTAVSRGFPIDGARRAT